MPLEPKPCSRISTLTSEVPIRLVDAALPGGIPGKVFKIPAPAGGGLSATVDYVTHVVTIQKTPGEIVLMVAEGIDVDQKDDGSVVFSVEPGYNVIPVSSAAYGEIGYFKSKVPPDNPDEPNH